MPTENLRTYLVRGTVWSLAAKTSGVFASFGLAAVLVRVLDPGEAGRYFLVQSVVAGAVLLGGLGLPQVAGRMVAALSGRDAGAEGLVIRQALLLTICSSAALGLAMGFGLFGWIVRVGFADQAGERVAWAAAAWTMLGALELLLAEVHRARYRILRASLLQAPLANAALLVLLSGSLLAGNHLDLEEAIYATVIAHIAATSFGFLGVLKRDTNQARIGSQRQTRVYSDLVRPGAAIMMSSMAAVAYSQGPIWILGALVAPADVALFSVAYRASLLVALPLVIISAVLPPVVVRLHDGPTNARLQRLLGGTAAAAFLVATVLLVPICRDPGQVLSTAFGGYYGSAGGLFLILALTQYSRVSGGPFVPLLIMTGHERSYSALVVVGTAFLLLLGYFLARDLEGLGMAVALLVGTVLQTAGGVVLAVHRTGFWTIPSVRTLLAYRRSARPRS